MTHAQNVCPYEIEVKFETGSLGGQNLGHQFKSSENIVHTL